MANVVQKWLGGLSFMQQTVVLSGIRGCDGLRKRHPAKLLIRWFRRCILMSAMDGEVLHNPWVPGGGDFSGESVGSPYVANAAPGKELHRLMKEVVDDFVQSRDEIPLHYFTHMMHAFQVLGYKHPDLDVRDFWHNVYVRMVHALHVWPETEAQMDRRLGDTMEGWKEREDAAGSCST